MDENEYRQVYDSVNDVRCVFEKAMLTRRFGCENLIKYNIAEREAAGCASATCQKECDQFLTLLRRNASFVLKLTSTGGPLPHAKELKAQCGGITGLQMLLYPDSNENEKIGNIYGLIREAKKNFNDLDQVPFQDINKWIAAFVGRKKRQRSK